MARKTRKVAVTIGAGLVALACTGCGTGVFVPSKSPNAWAGPPVWIESTPEWTVVSEPPIGGWRVMLDQVMEQRGHTEVFITLRPPNPSFIVTPSPVQQRVATPIRQNVVLWVYARQQNWAGTPSSGPFSLAAKSEDAKPPPAEAVTPAQVEKSLEK